MAQQWFIFSRHTNREYLEAFMVRCWSTVYIKKYRSLTREISSHDGAPFSSIRLSFSGAIFPLGRFPGAGLDSFVKTVEEFYTLRLHIRFVELVYR